MDRIVDAHSHISVSTPTDNLYNSYSGENLKSIIEVDARYKSVGIHPKYIKGINWDLIESLINENPSIKIGEIGLDKFGDNKELQIEVFERFLQLANRYLRSVSIHCVKEWGALFNCFKKFNTDIPHMFHGFSGSKESLKIALKGNSFFSFSQRELCNSRMIEVVKLIPDNRILVESDMSLEEFKTIGSMEYYNRVLYIYRLLSEIRGIDIKELIEIVKSNFKLFLNIGENK